MLAASHDEGLIEDFAHELLTGVLDFGDRSVTSVMVPARRHSCRSRRGPRCATPSSSSSTAATRGLVEVGTGLDDVCRASSTPRTC